MIKKKCKVVMLPTDKKAPIYSYNKRSHQTKNNWNKEEVIELIRSALFNVDELVWISGQMDGYVKLNTDNLNKWIEKNL